MKRTIITILSAACAVLLYIGGANAQEQPELCVEDCSEAEKGNVVLVPVKNVYPPISLNSNKRHKWIGTESEYRAWTIIYLSKILLELKNSKQQ